MSEHSRPESASHVSTGTLMLYLEGELSTEAEAVKRHLQSCWECRERVEWINQGIFSYLDYWRNVLLKALPEIEEPAGLLRQLLVEAAWPDEATGWRGAWRKMLRAPARAPVSAWVATAVSAFLFAGLAYLSLVKPASLTASEFLERVCGGSSTAQRTRRPGVKRRVRIRRAGRVFDRDIAANGVLRVEEEKPDAETIAALRLARVDWEEPLNPINLARWREAARNRRDTVRESATAVTLETTLDGDDPVHRIAFTARREDWVPTSQHIEFRRLPSIDIDEIPLAANEPAPGRRAMARSAAGAPPVRGAAPQVPTAEQLDDAEVRLRETLHDLQTDLNTAPEIRREVAEVRFLALATSEAKRNEILEAVHAIPYVAPYVVTPSMAMAGARQKMAQEAQPTVERSPAPPAKPVRPPLAEQLRVYCGGLGQANSYLALLAESQSETLMAASAVRNLAERYSTEDWNRLPVDLQSRLSRLIDDYDARMRRSARAYEALFSPVLDAMLRETRTAADAAENAAPARVPSWRETAHGVSDQVQHVQSIFARLFASTDGEAGGGPPIGALLLECDRRRSELKRLLQSSAEAQSAAGVSR